MRRPAPTTLHLLLLLTLVFTTLPATASIGDNLPEFKTCVKICINQTCNPSHPTYPPLHLRLLLWNCPSNCDYTCQRTITALRQSKNQSVEQFYGKWPFARLLGVQEPFSVFFSLLNGYAHLNGLRRLRKELPRSHPMAAYYSAFAYIGLVCWSFSALFHTRDFLVTERLDYFGAGANVMYGLYYSPIRIFRLYRPQFARTVRYWGYACLVAYAAHVYYLQFVSWDYTYNMAANVVVGSITNILWTWFSIHHYRRSKRMWATWPGLIVTWLVMVTCLELLDFPPVAGSLDAHALWHAGTILPVMWWYRFLLMDARQSGEGIDFARVKD